MVKKSTPRKSVKPSTGTKSGDPLDHKEVLQGVDALLKHHKRVMSEHNVLFEDVTPISVVVSVHAIPPMRVRPFAIPLRHSINVDAEVCVFVRDPQKKYREEFRSKKVQGVSKIMGVTKLRQNHREYEAKRKLCDSYDVFLADERILPLLPKLLGKKFFKTKKLPLAIKLNDPKEYKSAVQTALAGTKLVLSGGSTMNVLIGKSTMSAKDVSANLVVAMGAVAARVGGWHNVRALFVRTPSSVAVPVYTAKPLSAAVEKQIKQDMAAAHANNKDAQRAQRAAEGGMKAELGIEQSDDDEDDGEDEAMLEDDNDQEGTIAAAINNNDSRQKQEEEEDDDDDDEEEEDDDDSAGVVDRVRKERTSQPVATRAERLRAKAAAKTAPTKKAKGESRKRPATSATPEAKKSKKRKNK